MADWPCVDAATAPVRSFIQERRQTLDEFERAAQIVRFNERRAELERRRVELSHDWTDYNRDVTQFNHHHFRRQPGTGLYLPTHSGLTDPALNEYAPSSVPTMQNYPPNSPPPVPNPAYQSVPMPNYAPNPAYGPVQQQYQYPPNPFGQYPTPNATAYRN